MPTTDQPSLLARIRALSERIYEYRHRFSLPRGHKDRYDTHGAASALQKLTQERQQLQGQLDPIRLIATGISCRDCRWFTENGENEGPICLSECWPKECETQYARAEGRSCGPEARRFEPLAAHA